MGKRVVSIALALSMLLSMSGCWSKREINNLGIVDSVLYDMRDDGQLEITAEVLNYSGDSGSSGEESAPSNDFSVFRGGGKDVSEALKNVTTNYEKTVYLPFVKARFFTDKLAEAGLSDIVNYILYDRDIRENAFVSVIKSQDADKVFSATAQLSTTLGCYVEGINDTRKNSDGTTVFTSMLEFTRAVNSDERDAVVGVLDVVADDTVFRSSKSDDGSDTQYDLHYGGAAVFRDDVLAGYLSGRETQGYGFITGDIKNCIVTLSAGEPERVYSFEVLSSSCDPDVYVEDGRAVIDVSLKSSVLLIEGMELGGTEHDVAELERALGEAVRRLVEASIGKVQRVYKCDICGFGEQLHRRHPDVWRTYRDNWRQLYAEAELKVSSELRIKHVGETLNPYK